MGVFVVNYQNGSPGSLTLSNNQANNVAVSYDIDANKWTSATDIYWVDDSTPADVYGYYPFNNGMDNVDAYPFEVSANQSVAGTDGDMGSYEASDFLWAKAAGVTSGTKVNLIFNHRLAGVKVVLQQGEGFAEGEWDKLPKQVSVDNTVRTSTINLSTGDATVTGSFDRNIVMSPESDCYRAVVIPQTVDANKSTIGITIDGITYNYTRDGGMKYSAGKLHIFTLKIDSKGQSGDFAVSLVDEDISDWEVDQSSHDFESSAYLVVDVPVEGTLKKCLSNITDYTIVKNLKVTGKLTEEDFRFMREEMPVLAAVNLKDVKIVHIEDYIYGTDGYYHEHYSDDFLPDCAFEYSQTLRRVVLPETITRIGDLAFSGVQLISTLIIPNSVTRINGRAFEYVGEGCTIVLPNKLEYIEANAFCCCNAHIELILPSTLKNIGESAFWGARNVTGTFSLPEGLEYLGDNVFSDCGKDLEGDIVIPSSFAEVPAGISPNLKNCVNVKLHDGIRKIGNRAFSGIKMASPIIFPSQLKIIDDYALSRCSFVGEVKLPDGLSTLGAGAFAGSNISGTLTLPPNVESIPNSAFASCNRLEKVILGNNIQFVGDAAFASATSMKYLEMGKNISYIGSRAFESTQLQTIVCLAKTPPEIADDTFSDYYTSLFEHCVVEVPENSVELYRNASGWKKFRNITPHHELGLSMPEVTCLNKGIDRSLMVRAEGTWEIAGKPDWVTVTPDHAGYKEEVTIKVAAMSQGAGSREGRVVFRLKDSGYTNYLTVRQYDYAGQEDKEIVLQTASGKGKAIPVFIVGEGYGAESIANGDYMKRVHETVEQLFSIEPYKTYRNMFTVSTAVALSSDNGASDILTAKETKFSMYFPQISSWNLNELRDYAKRVSENVSDANIGKALIIVLSNYNAFNGGYTIDNDGCSVACVGISDNDAPFDNRGLVLRYAGGNAFGGLADETVNHNYFIKNCPVPLCGEFLNYKMMKLRGLFENVTTSGKISESPWRDFMFHPKYSHIVDMYEGGCNHLRGVWRSEAQSVMSTYIPYYNTISRYAIYRQIMRRAGLNASLDDFIANDKIEIPQ